MKKIIVILSLFLVADTSFANDATSKFQCGNASVTVYNSNIKESPFFVVTVNIKGWVHYYPFLADKEYLQVRCEKRKDGKDLLLINHFCGGSGCSESNYDLIDLTTGREVLKARTDTGGNSSEAEFILGKPIVPFSCLKHSKPLPVPNDKGEYCFISPLELG